MFVLRTKVAILKTVFEWLSLLFVAVSIYLAVKQPLFYILVAGCILLFLIATHKSNYVILKKHCVIYRKYWVWRKIKYDTIKVLFITKHSYSTKTSISDFHDNTTKQIVGCIFLMKDISHSAKESLCNSEQMYGEWSNTLIDFQYKNEFLEAVLAGGFNGDIFITDEMESLLGAEIRRIVENADLDTSIIKVLPI